MIQSELIEKDIELDGDFLVCPSCGEQYLHQRQVEVGWRVREDKDLHRLVSDPGGKITTDKLPDHEVVYGYRRDYIVVRFDCETCPALLELEIKQHKGNTHIRWVRIDFKEDEEE